MDGGKTWNLYDSTNNVDSSGNMLPIESTARNREFVGTTAFDVVVDPKLTPTGQVIIYAALSGPNGGIWRSEDTGQTWVNMDPGQATSVVLDADSGIPLNPDTDPGAKGNLQIVYAAFRGTGVFMSPNQGQVWNQMLGNVGNPLIQDLLTGKNVNPATSPSPNGAEGRITLAVPASTGNAVEDAVYAGWLYALVANPAGGLVRALRHQGLRPELDHRPHPHRAPARQLGSVQPGPRHQRCRSARLCDLRRGTGLNAQGNYDQALAVDPTNPNIVYVGWRS